MTVWPIFICILIQKISAASTNTSFMHLFNKYNESWSDLALISPAAFEVSHLITSFVISSICFLVIIISAITSSRPASYRRKLISDRTSLLLLRIDTQLHTMLVITNRGHHSDSQMCRYALCAPVCALPTARAPACGCLQEGALLRLLLATARLSFPTKTINHHVTDCQ